MDCYFESLNKGAHCIYCRATLPQDFASHPRRNCAGPPCPHLGPAIERDGVAVKVKCGCDGKERDQLHVAHECALHKRCLPTLVPADLAAWMARKPESNIYHLCHGCADRPLTAPPQSTPADPVSTP